MQRRQFLGRSLAATAAAGSAGWLSLSTSQRARAAAAIADQECYELRTFVTPDEDSQSLILDYLAEGLVPALNRLGVNRIGVFTEIEGENKNPTHSVYTLIPYTSVDQFLGQRPALASDQAYQKAAAAHLARPKDSPAYTRINSRLLLAFAGMPVIEQQPYSLERTARIFELRIYQSHNEDTAARKVEMFNSGEIQLMRDVEMAPVFYGETLVGDNVPCLTYMLSASDMDSHRAHWKAFINSPVWKKMKEIERYKGTVSHIDNWFLEPAACSQL